MVWKQRLSDFLWVLSRGMVGMVFAYAGFMKLLEPRENFQALLSAYPYIPDRFIPLLATVLPWCEWISGVLLILGFGARAAAVLISSMLLVFIGILVSALFLGVEVADCGCFGQSGWHLSPNEALVLDALWFSLTVLLIWRNRFPFSVEGWLRKK